MWRVEDKRRILTVMRGIIVVVVVGQEPLVIHVAPDGDDTPGGKMSRRDFRFAHKIRAQFLTLLHRRRVRGTRMFFTVPSATRYYASFCHPRRFAKGVNLLSRILANGVRVLLVENQRSSSNFRETSDAVQIEITRISNLGFEI